MSVNEYLKERLRDYVTMYLSRSPKAASNQWNCPQCGSGTKEDGTPAFSLYRRDGQLRWHCFACPPEVRVRDGDIFDLIGIVEHISSFPEKKRRLCEIFPVPACESDALYPRGSRPVRSCTQVQGAPVNQRQPQVPGRGQRQLQSRSQQQIQEEAPLDANYINACNRRLNEMSQKLDLRGISLGTLNRFHVGYDPEWTHPSNTGMWPSPRFIIPVGSSSYIARHINQHVKNFAKMRYGRVRWFLNFETFLDETAQKPIFVVEGEFDALSIIDVGGNAVALGSICNSRIFLNLLRTVRPRVPLILLLDNDDKGKCQQKKLGEDLSLLRIFHTDGVQFGSKDPNEAMQRNREEFTAAVRTTEEMTLASFQI